MVKIDTQNNKDREAVPKQFVVFLLGKEVHAAAVEDVREVVKFSDITPVPKSPTHIAGVINLRGKVLPIVDLEKRLGLSLESTETMPGKIIVIDGEDEQFGLMVGSVTDVIRVTEGQIRPTPETVRGKPGEQFVDAVLVLDSKEDVYKYSDGAHKGKVAAGEQESGIQGEKVIRVLNVKQLFKGSKSNSRASGKKKQKVTGKRSTK